MDNKFPRGFLRYLIPRAVKPRPEEWDPEPGNALSVTFITIRIQS